jgi:hypothetical protein
MLSNWLLIMVSYAEPVVVNHMCYAQPMVLNHVCYAEKVVVSHVLLCCASSFESWWIMLSQWL